MSDIVSITPIATELVLSERVVSTEFKVLEIQENVRDRYVRAEVELGPFVEETRPGGTVELRGRSRRGINVWENEVYDAIRDTWANPDLLARIKEILEAK